MRVNYCPFCGGEVISHYRTHVIMASYNEFYCEACFTAIRIDCDDIPEAALIALGYCPECKEKECTCVKEEEQCEE